MFQQWLNVAGLSLDFAGVLLLAYEWWLAISAEQREAELQAREQRLKPPPTVPRPNNPHQPVFDYMNEQMRFNQQFQRTRTVRGMRQSWFFAAFALIATGFMLQVLGSWPGFGM